MQGIKSQISQANIMQTVAVVAVDWNSLKPQCTSRLTQAKLDQRCEICL